jgi:surface antigen
MRVFTALLTLFLAGGWALQALADPPAHAPAHGWRKKHDPYYVGYTGTKWERDYDIESGRCNREEIGAVLGGVAGGVIGSRVGSPENRTVAIIIGAAAGALIGAKIGRELDEGDRGCFGHALEIGAPGRAVTWRNRATGVDYVLVPGEGRNRSAGTCREFTLTAKLGSEKSKRSGKACQNSTGVWKIA